MIHAQNEIIQDDAEKAVTANVVALTNSQNKTDIYQDLCRKVKEAAERYFAELEGTPKDIYESFLKSLEEPLLQVALIQAYGNQTKVAEWMGLNRGTLKKKMDKYGLLHKRNSRGEE